MRDRSDDEVIPVSAQVSRVITGKASHAIDLDLSTAVNFGKAPDDRVWMKITFDQIYCVDNVIEYERDGSNQFKWVCSQDDCSVCENKRSDTCKKLRLTVELENVSADLPLSGSADCKHGNSVQLERVLWDTETLKVAEMAVFSRKGG